MILKIQGKKSKQIRTAAILGQLAQVQTTSVVREREAQVGVLALNDAQAPGVAAVVTAFRIPSGSRGRSI